MIKVITNPSALRQWSVTFSIKKGNVSWEIYEDNFLNLMAKRNIERIDKSLISDGCLLCSEHKPHHCHRRLVIEYLNKHWDTDFEVKHLI
ncbi:DUF488 family protein, N3 subclade [Cronobacter muytjensii]|uniref:DUF488 family protein, N3 subclade n=1 Tax=Cronobacter muytjensii TaxID=413501 RepID=UPI003CF32E96